MIRYNPKDWFSFIFRFHKADTFRKLFPAMIGIAVYSGIIAYIAIEHWKVPDTSHLRNISVMHNVLGLVISLLLVFRTNTAYDRWWEGRKLWGELVNVSRGLAIKLRSLLGPGKDAAFFAEAIPLFAAELCNHLQGGTPDHDRLEALGIPHRNHGHVPNAVQNLMMSRIHDLCRRKKISGEQLIFIGPEISAFTNICGGCERIKNTPIPYSYSAFIKKFIFFYSITMPLGHAFTLGYFMIPIVIFIFYALGSLELIAEEIEDPFGKDANDLPLARLIGTIKHDTAEILL